MRKVYLSEQSYCKKPEGFVIGRISVTILNNGYIVEDVKDLANKLGSGFTALLSNTRSESNHEIHQNFVMLDFDNASGNEFRISDLENDRFLQENASFYYKTYNHSEETDRFRVVFELEEPLTSHPQVRSVYKYLFDKYPMSDTTIGQASRMFFGGVQGYTEINFDNRLAMTKEIQSNVDVMVEQENIEKEDDNTPNYRLLQLDNKELIRQKLGDNFKMTFPDEYSAANYFRQLDMVEILELPQVNPFLDIFHEEENPSASVFFSEENNIYLYKCFSEHNKLSADLLRVVSKLANVNTSYGLSILLFITGSEIDTFSELGNSKFNAGLFKKDLLSGALELSHPKLYSFLKRYKREINATLEVMYDYTCLDASGTPQYINFYSIATLKNLVSEMVGYQISTNKMLNILNSVIVVEIIQKLPESEMPDDIKNNLIFSQKGESQQIRTSNVYSPNNLTEEYTHYIESLAGILLDNKINVSSLSFEMIYRLFNKEKAEKDFPQAYKPLQERGLVKMSKVDENLTHFSIKLEKAIVKIISEELEENGYIMEDKLFSLVSRRMKVKKAVIQKHYARVRTDIMGNYGFIRQRMSKEIHEELNVSEKYTTKTIIFQRKD